MKRNPVLTGAAFAATSLGIGVSAHANVISSGLLNFNTITSGLDFITVQSSQTLQPGVVNIGLFFNDAINALPYFETSTQGRLNFNDNLLAMDFNLGVGLFPNLDAGISFPAVVEQSVDNTTVLHGEFSQTGWTEIRPNVKYHLLGDDEHGVAIITSVNFNRTVNNPYAGLGAGPTWNFEVAADTTIKRVRFGGNLGYRVTSPGTPVPGSPILPMGDQIIASAAASYLIPHTDTKAILEIYGSRPAVHTDSNSDRTASSLEMLLGLKHDFNINFSLHAGAGTELINGTSSPDWRVYTGVNYTFGPVFAKSRMHFSTIKDENGERVIIQNVNFEFDSDRMTPESEIVLDEVVKYLRAGVNFRRIVVEGHTDSVGSLAYNMDLSQRRANAIRNYLVTKYKFDPKAIEATGYGPTRPVADNGNYQGRQFNRRVEFKVER